MQMHKCNRGDVASSNTRAHARTTTPDIPKGNNKTKQGRGGGGYEARPKAAKDRGAATCLAYVQRRRRRRRRCYAAPWLSPRSSTIKKTQPASCFINSKTWYPWSGSLASRGIVTFTLAYASYRGVRSPGASRRCTVTHSVTHHCCMYLRDHPRDITERTLFLLRFPITAKATAAAPWGWPVTPYGRATSFFERVWRSRTYAVQVSTMWALYYSSELIQEGFGARMCCIIRTFRH